MDKLLLVYLLVLILDLVYKIKSALRDISAGVTECAGSVRSYVAALFADF